MNHSGDKSPKPVPVPVRPTTADEDGWNPHDEYDCRLNEPKQTQAYIDETRPAGVKEAIAKRQAELKAATAAVPETETPVK